MVDVAFAGPVALSLFSAVTLALANFAVKRGGDVLAARLVFAMAMAATVAPLAFFVAPPPRAMWPGLAASLAAHWIYQFAMIRALHRGDFSAVFPVMRGLAPMVTAGAAYVAMGETLSPLSLFGLMVACAALIVFGAPPSALAAARRAHFSSLLWAAMTAIGIGVYSVVDASVVRAAPSPFTFIVWLFLLDWVGVAVGAAIARRGALWRDMRPQLKNGVLGGAIGAVSYGAAVVAFTLTDVAMVTALRETAGFFAAILGVVFLKEAFGRRRIIAAAALAVGLAFLRLGA
ncbi:MAG: DMT family transporter [Pseudomonadota bacterium]